LIIDYCISRRERGGRRGKAFCYLKEGGGLMKAKLGAVNWFGCIVWALLCFFSIGGEALAATDTLVDIEGDRRIILDTTSII
jgi:hypothetical protein